MRRIMHASKYYVILAFCYDTSYHSTEYTRSGPCQAHASNFSFSSEIPNLRAHCNMKAIY